MTNFAVALMYNILITGGSRKDGANGIRRSLFYDKSQHGFSVFFSYGKNTFDKAVRAARAYSIGSWRCVRGGGSVFIGRKAHGFDYRHGGLCLSLSVSLREKKRIALSVDVYTRLHSRFNGTRGIHDGTFQSF